MDWSALLSAFGVVFIAELGDKTQLAVLTQTCKYRRPLPVFLGGSLALMLVTALGAAGGQVLTRVVPPATLQLVAAVAFIVMGLLMAVEAARSEGALLGGETCEVSEDAGEPRTAWSWRAFTSTLTLLFVAELGDKTQLAVLSLASGRAMAGTFVFIGGSLALAAVTALGVIGGQGLCCLIPERLLLWLSAAIFVVMGVLMGLGVL
jgi:putative Ca2+/H+ antiporter (TMEM165/GDT1 family)